MATLKDVAKETGLTVSTVSRVLNNRGYISEETRKKVYEAMKKLNYRPNEVARSLSKQTTNTIGVIVPHIRHPYFAELISNLDKPMTAFIILIMRKFYCLTPRRKMKKIGSTWKCARATAWRESFSAVERSAWKSLPD